MSEYLGNAFTDEQQTDPEAGISAFDLCIGMIVVCGCDNHSGGCATHVCSHDWSTCHGHHAGGAYPTPGN